MGRNFWLIRCKLEKKTRNKKKQDLQILTHKHVTDSSKNILPDPILLLLLLLFFIITEFIFFLSFFFLNLTSDLVLGLRFSYSSIFFNTDIFKEQSKILLQFFKSNLPVKHIYLFIKAHLSNKPQTKPTK